MVDKVKGYLLLVIVAVKAVVVIFALVPNLRSHIVYGYNNQ